MHAVVLGGTGPTRLHSVRAPGRTAGDARDPEVVRYLAVGETRARATRLARHDLIAPSLGTAASTTSGRNCGAPLRCQLQHAGDGGPQVAASREGRDGM